MPTLFTSDYRKYDGMDQATVQALRTELGLDTVFITEEAYIAWTSISR